ncbi:hypothetical protein H2203_005994 [Taxawa tesnikishii (nom. ined.)]|nr:hypothetical protein H2203_005994 [Dothideales sp. JES 119]
MDQHSHIPAYAQDPSQYQQYQQQTQGSYNTHDDEALARKLQAEEEAQARGTQAHGAYNPQSAPPLPPRNPSASSDLSSPIHYTRNPHKLVAYLVPFPKPRIHGVPAEAPPEGEKEDKVRKLQRKWQEEVREAKTSTAKTASWKGVKSKATRGISKAMSYTKSSNLEFLNRIGGSSDDQSDKHAEDGHSEGEETHRTVGLEEMVLVYPQSINQSPDQLKQEFVDTMLRSKSKAQRDAVLATGLLPVSAAIDILAMVIWPFGGLLEIDSVWAYASIRGAKTSRNVTKRLTSSSHSGKHGDDDNTLRLTFTPSPRLELLDQYLASRCHERDSKLFPSAGVPPTETDVLEAIGWSPSQNGTGATNWEDEQWEITEVKDDLKQVMAKGAREWDKWCKTFEKDPEKAMKK